MSVPKAPMDEDYGFIFGKNDVGSAWKCFDVKSESEAKCMKEFANDYLWLRIFAMHSLHISAACIFVMHVRHRFMLL